MVDRGYGRDLESNLLPLPKGEGIKQSNHIVTEARTWLGTRFHHQGRIKASENSKGGCDCIGLVIGIAKELKLNSKNGQLISAYDKTDYGRLPNGNLLVKALAEHLTEIPVASAKAGDILLFRFEDNPQHVGIISDYPDGTLGIIHCYAQARKVIEHRLDDKWRKRIVTAYSAFM